MLSVPFRTRFGDEILSLDDLELGHIESQLSSVYIDSELRSRLSRLRRVRNHLSHGEAVPKDLLEAIVRGQSVVSALTAGRRAVSPVAADEVRA